MSFDSSKSLIIWFQGQSNACGSASWSGKSTTGLYNKYAALENTVIDSKLLATDSLFRAVNFDSDVLGDILSQYAYNNVNLKHVRRSSNISMGFSFVVELIDYLNGIGFTKNVYYLNHGISNTSLQMIADDPNWGGGVDLFFESSERLKEVIKHEQEVNGNDCQVVNIWMQGEYDDNRYTTQLMRLSNTYDRIKGVTGESDPFMFLGQLVPREADYIRMNGVFFDFAAMFTNVHVVGEGLGVSTWQDMENNDPDGIILASDDTTYTQGGDTVHYNWSAQILQGRQLYDLFLANYLT